MSSDRAILVGVGLKPESVSSIKENLSELSELAVTAGAEIVGILTQSLESWNPATLIGSGKVDELKQMALEARATLVIFDHSLSAVQSRNLHQTLTVEVLDRTQLILDIFAIRARSHEGKLQVELAQLLDQSSRMVGAWLGSLSRQGGGGIGTRGPGEKVIETDRRTIRDRIVRITRELEQVRQHRSLYRSHRRRNHVPSFALIGYTNVGKSSLLNHLTHSEVLVEDKVFATLDPTTRKVFLPGSPSAVLTDTVGFIKNLPTQLIDAFRATLEESGEADVLLHVIDLSSDQWEMQLKTVHELVVQFGWQNKPLIHVFNKVDVAPHERKFQVNVATPRVFVSAKSGEGIELLKEEMMLALNRLCSEVELYFSNSDKHKIFDLARQTQITQQEENTQGVVCRARMTPQLISQWKSHLVQ